MRRIRRFDMERGQRRYDMGTIGTSRAAEPAPPALGYLLIRRAETGAIVFRAARFDFTMRPFACCSAPTRAAIPASPPDNSDRLAEIDCAGHRYRILRKPITTEAGGDGGDARGWPDGAGGAVIGLRGGRVKTIFLHAGTPRNGTTTDGGSAGRRRARIVPESGARAREFEALAVVPEPPQIR